MSWFVDRAKRYLLGNFENIFVLMTLLSTTIVLSAAVGSNNISRGRLNGRSSQTA